MSNHTLQYSVTGTPAEILYEVLSEDMWLIWLHKGKVDFIPTWVYEYACQQINEDDKCFLTEAVESILLDWLSAHSSIPAIYRRIREEYYDKYFTPDVMSSGGSWSDEARAMDAKSLTPAEHYHWAFVAPWQPHPVKGEGWALV